MGTLPLCILRVALLFGLGLIMMHVTVADEDEFHITSEDLEHTTKKDKNEENEEVMAPEESNEEEDTSPSDIFTIVEDTNNPEVLELLLDDGIWLVEYWSKNCSICTDLAPLWEKVAKLSKKKDIENFHVAQLNVEDNPMARMMHKIGGLPTIKLFRDGKNYTLPQPREFLKPKQYIKYATKTFEKEEREEEIRQQELRDRAAEERRQVDLTSKVVRLTPEDIGSLQTGNWLIDFYGARCSRCKKLEPKWEKVAYYAFRQKSKFTVARFDANVEGGAAVTKSFNANPWPYIVRVEDGVSYSHPDAKNFNDWDVEDYIEWGQEGYLEDYKEKLSPDIFGKLDKRAARKAKYAKYGKKKKKVIKKRHETPEEIDHDEL